MTRAVLYTSNPTKSYLVVDLLEVVKVVVATKVYCLANCKLIRKVLWLRLSFTDWLRFVEIGRLIRSLME